MFDFGIRKCRRLKLVRLLGMDGELARLLVARTAIEISNSYDSPTPLLRFGSAVAPAVACLDAHQDIAMYSPLDASKSPDNLANTCRLP